MSKQRKLEFDAQEDQVVAKANQLIRGHHDFTTAEQRIFVSMVAGLDRKMETFPEQEIRIEDVCAPSGIDPSNLYRRVDEITDNLLDKKIAVRENDDQGGEKRFKKYNVFSTCEYEKGSGTVTAKFNDDMSPFLLRLKKRFTLYLVTVFLRLKSRYSTQIYERLKMREDLRRLSLSVEALRRGLSIENKYSKFSDLKRSVLEKARKEMKEKADIYFTYRINRKNNSPQSVDFFIHDNDPVIRKIVEGDNNIPETVPGKKVKKELDLEDGSKDKSKSGSPKVDAKNIFLSDRNQEEMQSLNRDQVNALYEEAEQHVVREESSGSEVYLESMIASRMEKLWDESFQP
jgi:plasmid replication initiation protein